MRAPYKGGQNKEGFTVCTADAHATTKNISAAASHAHESELWLAFYILRFTSHKTRFFDRLRLGAGCRSPPRIVPTHWPERYERSLSMSGKKFTYNPPQRSQNGLPLNE